jgi:hypothetical protein
MYCIVPLQLMSDVAKFSQRGTVAAGGEYIGMAVLEFPADAPDTYGLPEYHVTEMRTEIDGRDIRMVFGAKRFGQIQWLYTVVISPERLMTLTSECRSVAEQAFNLSQFLGKHAH